MTRKKAKRGKCKGVKERGGERARGDRKIKKGRKKNLGMRKIKGQEKASRNQGNREVEGSGKPRDEKIESRDANK